MDTAADLRPVLERTQADADAGWTKWGIGLLLAVQMLATCVVLPPQTVLDAPFLATVDFPTHTHRAYVYREALRDKSGSWGYHPAVDAGIMLHPTQEVGSAPYQLLARLAPGVLTGRLVMAFAWLAMLIAPGLLACAGKMWGFRREEIVWGLLIGMGLLWFEPAHRVMVRVGMLAFLSSSYGCVFVLAAYDRFLRAPTWTWLAGATLAGSLLFLVHPFGPLAIAPALVVMVARMPGVSWRWRCGAACSPLLIAAVNMWWLFPVLQGLTAAPPPWSPVLQIVHPFFNWSEGRPGSRWWGPWLFAVVGVMLLIGCAGLLRIGRRQSRVSAVGIGLVVATTLLLFLFGSSWSVTRILQPTRFGTMFWNFIAVLGGVVIVAVRERFRIPSRASAALLVLTATVLGGVFVKSHPLILNDRDVIALMQFVERRTDPRDRILLQSVGSNQKLGQAAPEAYGREFINNSFPDTRDPIQFLPGSLFDKAVDAWTPDELHASLARFGVNWALVRSADWIALFRQLSGDEGEAVGSFRAFRVSTDQSRFLIGSGHLSARVNRIELRDANGPGDYVVLRYRYHPGWTCELPTTIESYPIPEQGGGLMLVRNPQSMTILRFDPLLGLRGEWPANVPRISE